MSGTVRRVAGVLVVGMLVGTSFTSAAAASGAEAGTASIETSVENEVLWVKASISSGHAEAITTKIFAPTKKRKTLFQRCNFSFSGPGDYRCGIDAAEGSLAERRSGRWTAKVLFDGEVVARRHFAVRS